ncbi:hypothetical protein GW932_00785 [archaeon]|nr:hypothetical protein [archaeon]
MVIKLNATKNDHDQYLENLVFHLEFLNEDKKDIQWIMKDGLWQKGNDRFDWKPLCDLIVIYNFGYGIPIELKGRWQAKPKAKQQICSGREFIEEVLKIPAPYGKVVVYTEKGYEYKKFDFEIQEWGNKQFYPFK